MHGEVELVRRVEKARREHQHDDGRGGDAGGGDQKQDPAKKPRHVGHQLLHFLVGSLGLVLGQHRHEGGGERALGEQPPQQIGNAEGDEEGIGAGAGAEHARDDDVAHETQDSGYQGVGADPGGGLDEASAHGCWLVACL